MTGKFFYNIEESGKDRICFSINDKDLFQNKKFLDLQFKIQPRDELFVENITRADGLQKLNETM